MSEQPWETWMKRTPLRWLLVAPLERIHPWGFEGMSAWNVFRFFVVGVMEGALGIRAAAIAFQVFVWPCGVHCGRFVGQWGSP
jgi:hypothetical protein